MGGFFKYNLFVPSAIEFKLGSVNFFHLFKNLVDFAIKKKNIIAVKALSFQDSLPNVSESLKRVLFFLTENKRTVTILRLKVRYQTK